MKKYEKILLLILGVLTLATLLLPGSVYLFACSFLLIWLLGLSYFLGGHSLFYTSKEKEAYLPLFAGLSYGPAVVTLSLSTSLQAPDYFIYFPIPALLLTLGLSIYILIKRKKGGIDAEVRAIFYRGLAISLLSSFFLYTPESFKPFRMVLLTLNKGNSSISDNIRMMHYLHESKTALDQNDCDLAIEYALESNQYGKKLIEITEENNLNAQTREKLFNEMSLNSTIEINSNLEQLFQHDNGEENLSSILRSYTSIYNAYFCKAENLYEQKEYKEALSNYLAAYRYLTTPQIKSQLWQEEKSVALNMIAHCYRQLNNIDLATYFYTKAILNYTEATRKKEIDLTSASYFSNIAFLMTSQNGFAMSNEVFEMINTALLKVEQTPEHKKVLLNNYQAQVINYVALDSLQQAFTYIQKAQQLTGKNSTPYYNVQQSLALCQFKASQFKKAESTIKDCIRYFEETSSSPTVRSIESIILLGQIYFVLGQFEKAEEQLTLALNTTSKSFGKTSELYAYTSKLLGDINKIVGNYSIANQHYQTALDLYNSGQIMQTHNIPLVLASLSDLALLNANFVQAQILADESLHIGATTLIPFSPNTAILYNQSAYVAYHRGNLTTADTLYQKAIVIAENYNLSKSTIKAHALNGLGLVEMGRKKYTEADKYFKESLVLHKDIYSDTSPFTAQVYLNHGILNIREGKLVEAQTKLDQALKINQQFLKSDHPTFGDLYVAYGDLAQKKGQVEIAKTEYNKALSIYKKYFDDTHWKIRELLQKLK